MVNDPEFVTIEGALIEINRLGIEVSLKSVQKMAREKELPFFKTGKRLYISRDSIAAHYRAAQQRMDKVVEDQNVSTKGKTEILRRQTKGNVGIGIPL